MFPFLQNRGFSSVTVSTEMDILYKETSMDPRHGVTNWDYSDQLVEKLETYMIRLATF